MYAFIVFTGGQSHTKPNSILISFFLITCHLLGLDVDFSFNVLWIDVVHPIVGCMHALPLVQNVGSIVLIFRYLLEVLLVVLVIISRALQI